MIVLKWLGIILATGCALYLVGFLVLLNMFNIGPRTERQVLQNASNTVLLSGATLTELDLNAPDSHASQKDDYSKQGVIATPHLLQADGSLVPGAATLDEEVDREYQVLATPHYSFAFKREALFTVVDGKIGEKIAHWEENSFTHVSYAGFINQNVFIVAADTGQSPGSQLYQIEVNSLKASKIAKDVYYTFIRPPMVFNYDSSIVAVYYVGSYDYAFGGDSSRPQKSVVRIYNSDYPDGRDLVELSFASGTVVDAAYEGTDLLLVADPSRPSMHTETRLPPRYWKIAF